MINDNSIYEELDKIFNERRKKATEKSEYIQSILFNDDEYLNAYNSYNSARFEISKAKYLNDNDSLIKFKKLAESFHKQMEEKIEKLGFSANDFNPSYECNICFDQGITADGKRCQCYKKALSALTLEKLNISNKKLPSFDNAKYKELNNLDKIYQKMQSYCDNFSKIHKNIVISGNVGTGKSYLAGCIANELLLKNYNVVFISACELNSVLLKYHTSSTDNKPLYLDLLTGCDLLIIDDLGSEPIYKNVTEEYLLMIITLRILNGNPFIITTNLEQEQLLNRYGDRTLSRLNDKRHGVFITINGKDLRRFKD